MARAPALKETFVIQILNTQNATWQGTVSWTNSKITKPFRSALELIKMIDSTLQKEDSEAASEE